MAENEAIARINGESKVAHRAFLLYAMQTPQKRNMRATSRAVQRSNSTVRGYAKVWKWEDRMGGDLTLDVKAQALYRELYFSEYGITEITMIEKNIVAPVSVIGSKPRDVADTVSRVVQQSEPPKSQVFTDEMKRRHLTLVDAGIGYIAQGIKNGDIRRSLRDLPLLMQLRREITGEDKKDTNAPAVVESARVRTAKSMGGDIVAAMYEDAQELCAILGALSHAGTAPTYSEINKNEQA